MCAVVSDLRHKCFPLICTRLSLLFIKNFSSGAKSTCALARYLRRELALLTTHDAAELDRDPMLAYRIDQLLQMMSAFGYSLPANGSVLEIEGLSDVIECLEDAFEEHVSQAREGIQQVRRHGNPQDKLYAIRFEGQARFRYTHQADRATHC